MVENCRLFARDVIILLRYYAACFLHANRQKKESDNTMTIDDKLSEGKQDCHPHFLGAGCGFAAEW
jgi:hypothetical protein